MSNKDIQDLWESSLEKNLSKASDVDKMLKEISGISKVEKFKEEMFVIRCILRGSSKTSIISELNKKHRDAKFIHNDIIIFLDRNSDILRSELDSQKSSIARRILRSREGINNELADLVKTTKSLVKKYDGQEDNGNTIAAIRTMKDILVTVAKMEGHMDEKPDVSINIQMDKVVNNSGLVESDFKKNISKFINKDVIDVKVVNNE